MPSKWVYRRILGTVFQFLFCFRPPTNRRKKKEIRNLFFFVFILFQASSTFFLSSKLFPSSSCVSIVYFSFPMAVPLFDILIFPTNLCVCVCSYGGESIVCVCLDGVQMFENHAGMLMPYTFNGNSFSHPNNNNNNNNNNKKKKENVCCAQDRLTLMTANG